MDLVPEARRLLEAEMNMRGILPASQRGGDAGSAAVDSVSTTTNPYAPPTAVVFDRNAPATLAVSGLIRLFQIMVIMATLIGIFLFVSPFLPLPIGEQTNEIRGAAGAEAISFDGSRIISLLLQPLWILSAVGLCFLKWWGRRAFVATYVLSAIQYLIGGVVVWLPWEAVLIAIATLLDGAVLALAFLPPLSTYFAHDRPD